MRINVFPIDFMGQPPLWEPRDRRLHDLAIAYCQTELAEEINLTQLAKVWVATECNDNDKPEAVCGITGYVLRPDIPIFRVSGEHANRATKMLNDRLQAHFADQGWRGGEVFLHISSKERPEQRCENWQQSLKQAGAEPADRYKVRVR
jgi:hypothetical protein